MKHTQRIWNVAGKTLVVTIPAREVQLRNLQKGQLIEIDFEKVFTNTKNDENYNRTTINTIYEQEVKEERNTQNSETQETQETRQIESENREPKIKIGGK